MDRTLRHILRENSLSLVLLVLFGALIIGESVAGYLSNNEELADKGSPQLTFSTYLTSSHFLEATAENWESEFLQMFAFIVLTTFLYQRGSAESKDPDKEEQVDERPETHSRDADAPWPVKKGGVMLLLYKHSLTSTFFLLFVVSFVLHAMGGAGEYNQEQLEMGKSEQVSLFSYIATSRFWFESFQNWQSEFLAIWAMVVFTIFLREKGSPESKPVHSRHRKTGKS